MKNLIFIITIYFITPSCVFSQDLTVPETILNELEMIQLKSSTTGKDSILFKVIYPDNYNPKKKYRVFLCLSGGNQSEAIVNYCYAAWFRSNQFKDYFTILPISQKGKNLREYHSAEIQNIENTIKQNFKVTNCKWILAGTSNGGIATFNFISESPKLYEGAIVMPGTIDEKIELTNDWKHLKIVLVYGTKDSQKWIEESNKTEERIKSYINKVSSIELKDQGHILPIGYEISEVYDVYFGKNK